MATQEIRMGKAILRWAPAREGGFAGSVIIDRRQAALIHDDDETRLVKRLRNEAGKLHPDYVGFDGAIKRYLHFFPEGFRGETAATWERGYKERAAERLQSALTIDRAVDADDDAAARVASAGIQTNMLSPFEAARLNDTLRGDDGGRFLRGAALFALGSYRAGVENMAAAVQPHGRISWPIITYLPFLWDHRQHMFLKPKVTTDFADRVGQDFHHRYAAEPNEDTYLALLDLVAATRTAIASLEPRDNIDIQSFIWVVGEYREKDKPA